MRDADEERAREIALRVRRLLDHVDGVLEADDREERERGAADDERERVAAGVELESARRLTDALAQRPSADQDDDQEACELDAGHHDVELHGLADTAEVDVREPEDEQRHEHDERHGRELLEVARKGAARRSHRRQRRAHHGEADEERHEAVVERTLRIERGTGRVWVLADELEIRRRREHGDDERAAECEPRRTADAPRDIAGQRVDARCRACRRSRGTAAASGR